MTNEELTTLLTEWQKRLRLQDWDVTVALCRQDDLKDDDEESTGRVEPLLDKRAARIKVLDPQDVYGDWIEPYDAEIILVHELIHLLFEPFWRASKRLEQEQAIVALSKALVATKREGLTSKPPKDV